MIGISFLRVLRAALQNFFRNVWLSIATTVIMTMTLLIVLFLYFANVFGLEVIRNIEQKVDLSADLKAEASSEEINRLADRLEARGDVAFVRVVSSEEAKDIFLKRNQDKPFIEEALAELEGNPLPASVFITATEPRYYEQIAIHLAEEQYSGVVDEVKYESSREIIENLTTVINAVKNAGIIVTALFATLVVLIMFNTVRLAIYSFREEIDIMHLVGASRWFIRGPFLIESVLVAMLAVLIATAFVYPVLNAASPHLQSFFFEGAALGQPFDVYLYAKSHWAVVIGLQAGVAILLAVLSSLIAIQRYLKR